MFDREGKHLVDAIATQEGKIITDDSHEFVSFEYKTEDSGSIERWELRPGERVKTEFNNETCYYVPAYKIDEDDNRSLKRIVLLSENAEIKIGEHLNILANMGISKDKLSDKVWEEERHDIHKRQALLGGVATGGAALFSAGMVVGVIGIKKWVAKRK